MIENNTKNGKTANRNGETEVVAKAQRRQYSAEYKQRILAEAAQCNSPSEVGALLRREGLYSSLISKWRQRSQKGAVAGLATQKRGPKVDPQAVELVRLQQENERLRERLRQAELIIEVQKKVSQILGVTLATIDPDELK
jgi:transposase-like protein